MGQCYGKDVEEHTIVVQKAVTAPSQDQTSSTLLHYLNNTYSHASSPLTSPLPIGVSPSPARATPRRFFRRPFPPPSPAKHIYSSLVKRHGVPKRKEPKVPEVSPVEGEKPLDKNFGYSKNFSVKYDLGQEVGRGHFGHTCYAKVCKGELKGQSVAVKIISKEKMMTAIAIEDVRREVKILKALSGHHNLVIFHDVCEDDNNVYIIMELCEGGELLDRILSSGGKFSEEDAKGIVVQILSVVAFCHLQGVVHRDLKPENFLFTTKDENAPLRCIDFGLSDFIRPDERLNDIVGSAYYVAPEVLHQSYSMEADVWSIGVITYILLCGSRPFWARSESGIFRAVLRAEPNFDDAPWPSISPEAKDFVKRLLNKDLRKRMSAAQALSHPWLCGKHVIPLDILVYKRVKAYLRYLPLKRAALKALVKSLRQDELVYLGAQFKLLQPDNDARISLENFKSALMRNSTEAMKESKVPDILNSGEKTLRKINTKWFQALVKSLRQDELVYLGAQFKLLQPDNDARISLENFKSALMRNSTEAMKESKVPDILNSMNLLAFRKMNFEEFCAAATSVYQLEALDHWEEITRSAFAFFEQQGNRVISVEELAQELNLGPNVYAALHDWIRHTDGKLSFFGFTKFLHGVTLRSNMRTQCSNF